VTLYLLEPALKHKDQKINKNRKFYLISEMEQQAEAHQDKIKNARAVMKIRQVIMGENLQARMNFFLARINLLFTLRKEGQ
jgi:hypothetical protein